jgi:hypothetical protein
VKKELDVLFEAGRGACASLQIAKSSELTAMEIAAKLKLVPGLVKDWKHSAARDGTRTTLKLAKAHYPELSLDLITSGMPKTNEDGMLVDEAAIRHSVLGYNQLCTMGTQMNVHYEPHIQPGSPSGGGASAAISDTAEAADGGNGATSAPVDP